MLKKALFVASAAIALAAASSLPALATGSLNESECAAAGGTYNDDIGLCDLPNTSVPEPSAILGTLLIGGVLCKKAFDANNQAVNTSKVGK
jgi:hypothetical protein